MKRIARRKWHANCGVFTMVHSHFLPRFLLSGLPAALIGALITLNPFSSHAAKPLEIKKNMRVSH